MGETATARVTGVAQLSDQLMPAVAWRSGTGMVVWPGVKNWHPSEASFCGRPE
jgi:hypothetical protein